MCCLSFSVLLLSLPLSSHFPSASSHVLSSSRLVFTAHGIPANHLSPQALKWREYRRRNPLGLNRVSGLPSLAGSLDRRQQEPRLNRGNPIFELPGALSTSHFHCKLNGAHHLSAGGSWEVTLGLRLSFLGAQVKLGFITALPARSRRDDTSIDNGVGGFKKKVKIASLVQIFVEPPLSMR